MGKPPKTQPPITAEAIDHIERTMGMVLVPAEAFGLLFAYCHMGQLDVPAVARVHPDYPGLRDGRQGHLIKALRPHADRALALIPTTPRGEG